MSDAVRGFVGEGQAVDRARCERFLYGLNGGGVWSSQGLGQVLRHRLGIPPDFSFRRLRQVAGRNKPGKSFDVAEVRALLDGIARVCIQTASSVGPISAAPARDGGHYVRRLLGASIAVTCDG